MTGQTADIQAAYDWLTSETGGGPRPSAPSATAWGARVVPRRHPFPLRASVSYYGGGIAPSPRPNFPDLLGRAGDLYAPVLLIWGGKDGHIGPDQVRATEDALRAAGKPYTQAVFSEADHGFFCDARASFNPIAATTPGR